MADQKTVRNALLITGAAAAGYFLWKYTHKDNTAGSTTDAAPTRPTTPTPTKETKMTHILHLDSSPRGGSSHSRMVSGELVEALKAANPGVTVTYRDLGHQEIPYVNETFIGAMYTPAEARSAEQNEALTLAMELVDELKAADTYVFGIPMYNFTVPGVFKSYIDQVVFAGVTWDPATYTGLLLNKKAYVVTARGGGGYGPGEAREVHNSQDPVLKSAFGLMGVTDMDFIHINNTIRGDDVLNGALAEAREKIAAIAKTS